MQVETPHHPPNTLRGFIAQYAMIVLSILTALALEQIVVSVHNASTARDSRARIDAELARFVTDLKNAIQKNNERMNAVNAVLTVLDARLKDGKPDDASLVTLAQPAIDELGVSFPSFRREAWDAAIADQSVSHLDPADLQRYSEIYAEEAISLEEARLLLTGEYVRRLSDANLDFRIGRLDGRDLAQTLTLDVLAGQDILHHQEKLLHQIERGRQSPEAK
jgi:hypothetical protein